MTQAQLRSIGIKETDEQDQPTLKEEIEATVKTRQAESCNAFKDWMRLWAKYGATTLIVEECPLLIAADIPVVLAWLKSEEFEIKRPGFLGSRTVVTLAKLG